MERPWTRPAMNSSVNEAFHVFDQRIYLSHDDLKVALDEASTASLAISADPAITGCIITGSAVRSTAIKDFSDVDLIAIIADARRSNEMTPKKALALVMHIMSRYMDRINDSGNSVSAISKNGVKIDVIPAFIGRINDRGDQVYEIPTADRSGWQDYSPDAQTRRIAEIDERAGPRFKQLVRAIKWWSRTNGQPISSHQIEVFASEVFDAGIPELSQAVVAFFEVAIKDLLITSQGTATIASDVDILGSSPVALSKMRTAEDHAKHAREIELASPGSMLKAVQTWRGLFGEQFPDVLS